jgi:TFIIF-interacting CTD phosphatase-like protein
MNVRLFHREWQRSSEKKAKSKTKNEEMLENHVYAPEDRADSWNWWAFRIPIANF